MANVIQDTLLGDRNAFYVWAGVTGPRWGSWESFAADVPVKSIFAESDWQLAVAAAVAQADRSGIPSVYVARNG